MTSLQLQGGTMTMHNNNTNNEIVPSSSSSSLAPPPPLSEGEVNNISELKIDDDDDDGSSAEKKSSSLPNDVGGGGAAVASAALANDDGDLATKDDNDTTSKEAMEFIAGGNNSSSASSSAGGSNPQPLMKKEADAHCAGAETIAVAVGSGGVLDTANNNGTAAETKSDSDLLAAATANKLTGASHSHSSNPTSASPTKGLNNAQLDDDDDTATATGTRKNDGGEQRQQTHNSPSFSMTLAIGPNDTQRVFHASRAFNAEIQKLQTLADETSSGSGTSLPSEGEEQMKRKSMDSSLPAPTDDLSKKKKPAIVHSPPSREDALKPPLLRQPCSVDAANSTTTTVHPCSASNTASRQSLLPTTTGPQPLRNLLLPAAKSTNDTLLQSFLRQMEFRNASVEEKQTCLLFFLDADKSTKLLSAFDVLSNSSRSSEGGGRNDDGAGEQKKDEDSSSKLVGRRGLIQLFQSFLTSISTCVHGDKEKGEGGVGANTTTNGGNSSRASTPTVQNTSPSIQTTASGRKKEGDWKGSDRTQKEILEVATFAADNLIEYGNKERNQNNGGREKMPPTVHGGGGRQDECSGVSFDIFGKWYNSGGFSLVPWLELLDLSKWDYTGTNNNKASSNATAAARGQPASSSKRARIQDRNEPLTPGVSNMNEPIGSPTALFASGAMLGATPQPTRFDPSAEATSAFEPPGGNGVRSFSAMFGEMDESRTVVSFDFSGSSNPGNTPKGSCGEGSSASSFHIDITEENLVMLRNLVQRTGFATLTPQHVESLMMKHARPERQHNYGETIYVISRAQFGKFIREVVPKDSSKHFDPTEVENFSNYFTNFFTCFDYSWSELKKDEVNAKELLVGFSFLFAGNKSTKLAAAYEMLDVDRVGYLSQRGLMQYLRSYLTMLAGISLLSSNKKTTTQIRKRLMMSPKRDDAFLAVENGAKWTLSHFLRSFEQDILHSHGGRSTSTRSNAVTFEDFAKWYTEGGYAVAPWLELLDLQKFLSLIGNVSGSNESTSSSGSKPPPNSNDQSLSEVMFTFPLANSRSLVVLRDDAHYVRSVVNELGLLELTSEDIWNVLFNDVAKSLALGVGGKSSNNKKSIQMEVDQMTFVNCMMRILNGTGKLKQNSSWKEFSPEDTLKNFYLSFDLAETKVVPLNQLMCGLTLLCGGKKSNKLVFAFSLFGGDESGKHGGKKKASMTHNDFFFFFRSFLIVMFSCCNQSLSLSADAVTQYISDTAKSVADDVMSYWKAKKVEKVKFENFSEWYNEGGFETAPWLELLDLNKWVLADQPQQQQSPPQQQQQQQQQEEQQLQQQHSQQPQQQQAIPPTPAPARNSSRPEEGYGLTPGHESIKALLATPKIKANNGSSPNNADCPPAPDDDPLFDLDMSAVDAEVDEMDFILQHETADVAHQSHVENVNYVDPAAAAHQTQSRPAAPPQQNALKFNLLTHDPFGGYMISIGPSQVQLLHRLVTETGLYQIDAPTICKFILYDNKSRRVTNLTKKAFHSAMKRVFEHAFRSLPAPVSNSTQDELSAFTEKLFTSFDRPKTGKINAIELACGFSVLCEGRKSDKLEHVFELLDQDKDTLVSQQDITRFIQSFLIMLMSVSSSFTHLYGDACSNDITAISRAIEAGSEWATSQVFDALPNNGTICFDDFADWYTKGGYQSMPWLELLDLRKWVLGDS